MKRMDILKGVLFAAAIGASGVADAQIQALHFGGTGNNWFSNYVGVRVSVTGPSTTGVLGDKQFTISNDGSGASSMWGGAVPPKLVIDKPIKMEAVGGDTIVATTTLTAGSYSGKIAFIYRGGSEFGHKALQAQNAGALACVIVNNIAGGPVGMGAGAEGASVTIPVVMISKEDGDAIDAQYRSGVAISMTITNWGSGAANDIGFVPAGTSMWHAYAVPADQLASGTPEQYKAVDGAFIANYGSNNAAGVSLSTTTTFTPTGGTPSTIHTSTVTLGAFAVADSVIAMFDTLSTASNIYSVTASGTGRFDQTYTLAATTDDYMANNTATTSFYATDSLYSKGRYDFANKKPFSTLYSGRTTAADVIWGNMYYVNKGGAVVSNVQYSFSMNTTTANTVIDAIQTNAYIFKWVDANSDNVLQNGELTLMGTGSKNYITTAGTADTSGGTFAATGFVKTGSTTHEYVTLEDNSFYYVAVQVPAGYYVGCDGVLSQYPRIFGHLYNKTSSYLEYSNLNFTATTDADIAASPDDNNPVMPYTLEGFISAVDSFNYDQSKGLIPSISMTINKNPGPIVIDHSGVNNVSKSNMGVSLFPNPASTSVTVDLSLDKTAPTVSYTVIDGLARIVAKDVTNNVKNEKHTINTSKLAAGNYNLIINANGEVNVQKFTIVK